MMERVQVDSGLGQVLVEPFKERLEKVDDSQPTFINVPRKHMQSLIRRLKPFDPPDHFAILSWVGAIECMSERFNGWWNLEQLNSFSCFSLLHNKLYSSQTYTICGITVKTYCDRSPGGCVAAPPQNYSGRMVEWFLSPLYATGSVVLAYQCHSA